MALPAIRDFLTEWPGWATLAVDAGDTFNTLASGETRVWELREQLWRLSASSVQLRPTVAARWEALLESLENGKRLFWGYDLARFYPTAYPHGSWPTGLAFSGLAAGIEDINANRKAIALNGLPAGYKVTPGDMLQITHDDSTVTLVRAMEEATAAGDGKTAEIEIRPHLPDNADDGDVVAVKRPAVRMILRPNSTRKSVDPETGMVKLSFEGVETLEVPS